MMRKCKIVLALCLGIISLLSVMGIGNKTLTVGADSAYNLVTFNYNKDRVLSYIVDKNTNPELKAEIENSLKEHVVYVSDGGHARPNVEPHSIINNYYTYEWTNVNGDVVDPSTYSITEDTVFFAKWTPKEFKAYLNYGGIENEITNLVTNYTFTVESPRIVLYTPRRPNYVFVGWYDTPNDIASKQYMYIESKSVGDKRLYAKFAPMEYYIDYNTDAEHNNPRKYHVENDDITLLEPTLYGHIFKGWYADTKFNTPVTNIDCSKGGNIELYAKWELEVYEVTYILPNGLTKVVEVEYGKKVDLPKLNKSIFEIVKTDVSRKNITEDTTIEITLVNIWYVYVIAIMVIAGTVATIILVKKKRENTHNTLRNMYYSNSGRNNKRKY